MFPFISETYTNIFCLVIRACSTWCPQGLCHCPSYEVHLFGFFGVAIEFIIDNQTSSVLAATFVFFCVPYSGGPLGTNPTFRFTHVATAHCLMMSAVSGKTWKNAWPWLSWQHHGVRAWMVCPTWIQTVDLLAFFGEKSQVFHVGKLEHHGTTENRIFSTCQFSGALFFGRAEIDSRVQNSRVFAINYVI